MHIFYGIDFEENEQYKELLLDEKAKEFLKIMKKIMKLDVYL